MSDGTEDVVVTGKPVDADDRGLDNTPDKDDSPELASVKAFDRDVEQKLADADEAQKEHAPEGLKPEVVEQKRPEIDSVSPTVTKKLPEVKKAEKKGEYEVQVGENILDVAQKFGTTADKLASINHLATGYRELRPGQILKLYAD